MRVSLIIVLLLNLASAFPGVQHAKTPKPVPGPKIESFEPSSKLLMTCGPAKGEVFCSTNRRTTVTLEVKTTDSADEELTYTYSVTDGEILGEGSRVTWDLQSPVGSIHKATVTVRNSRGGESSASTTVDIYACPSCVFPDPPCPTMAVSSWYKEAHRAEQIGFEVQVSPGYFRERPDYVWTIVGGRILRGQHTPIIHVLVTGDIDSEVTATVKVSGGFDPSCAATTASHSLPIRP
jgi:hypothetical protein